MRVLITGRSSHSKLRHNVLTMKLCPQCNFIYLDTDKVCDLDGTPLVFVTEADADAVDNGDAQQNLQDIAAPPKVASPPSTPPSAASDPITPPDVPSAPVTPPNAASDPGTPPNIASDPDATPKAASAPDATPNLASASVAPPPAQQSRKALVVAALAGLTMALALLAVYYGASRRTQQTPQGQGQVSNESSSPALTQQQLPTSAPSPPASASPSEEASPSPTARSSPSPRTTPAWTAVSSNPVSTSGEQQGGKSGSSIIRLTNGVKIEADEVWRTKEGTWYRRNGVVTFLKRNRVQAIERKP
jgi:hypothetical protein